MFRSVIALSAVCSRCLKGHLLKRNLQTTAALSKALSDFHRKKITTEFDHFYDKNGDGYFDKADIEGLKRRLREYCYEAAGTSMVDAYSSGYEDYLLLMIETADSDQDGRVSRDSWIKLWEKIIADAKDDSFSSLPQWVRIMPAGLFPVLDLDSDGEIGPEEYRKFWHHVGGFPVIGEGTLRKIFDEFTEGGKYKMNLERVQDLYADFYLSDDPDGPGKFISGPVQF